MNQARIAAYTLLAITTYLASCSNSKFAGSGGDRSAKQPAVNQPAGCQPPEHVQLNLNFGASDKTLLVSTAFQKAAVSDLGNCEFKVEYTLDPGSVKTTPNGSFPIDMSNALTNATYILSVTYSNSKKTFQLTVSTHGLKTDNGNANDQTFTLTQESPGLDWNKDEGVLQALGSIGETVPGSKCQIESSGNQPTSGVYAIILTKPAPCDFKLPSVKVGNEKKEFAIGTYWTFSGTKKAHSFPTTDVSDVSSHPLIDNGFILVQPDHKSYLLVDGGLATDSTYPQYKDAKSVAEQVSQSLGFGSTSLLQPVAGSANDNFATSTVFKAGSVVIIYDDTPDMAGEIDIKALLINTKTGMSLKWDAKAS